MSLADVTDPRFTADVAAIGAFESAPTPPEVREAAVLEEVARALHKADHASHGGIAWDDPDFTEWERDVYRRLAAAAVAAYRATQDGGAEEAVRRVEALCDETENRWPDFSPAGDPLPYVVETSTVRAALATQAGDGAR